MSNGLAYTLSSLTFDSTDLQRSDLTVHLEVAKGLDEGPNARGVDSVVPHLAGQVSRFYIADTLDVELFGFVQGDGATEALRRASFRAVVEELKALFAPGFDRTLAGVDAGGATYQIEVKPISDPLRWGPQDIPGYRPLTVLLIATQPFWTIG